MNKMGEQTEEIGEHLYQH
jgi:hypothetical protein